MSRDKKVNPKKIPATLYDVERARREGHTAAETNVMVAATALKDADVIIIRPGGDVRYEKEGDTSSGPAGHLPLVGEGIL